VILGAIAYQLSLFTELLLSRSWSCSHLLCGRCLAPVLYLTIL
jgi:hypothetical protein